MSNLFIQRADHPQMIGLLFDILGAYFLSQGLITKSLKNVVEESRGDENKPYLGTPKDNYGVGLYVQAVEARTGFFFLFIGFVLQGISYLFEGFIIPYHIGTYGLLIGLFITVIVHKRLFVYPKILKKIEETEKEIDVEFWDNFNQEIDDSEKK